MYCGRPRSGRLGGSGKTTLLKIITGGMSGRRAGVYRYLGNNCGKCQLRQVRKMICFGENIWKTKIGIIGSY